MRAVGQWEFLRGGGVGTVCLRVMVGANEDVPLECNDNFVSNSNNIGVAYQRYGEIHTYMKEFTCAVHNLRM